MKERKDIDRTGAIGQLSGRSLDDPVCAERVQSGGSADFESGPFACGHVDESDRSCTTVEMSCSRRVSHRASTRTRHRHPGSGIGQGRRCCPSNPAARQTIHCRPPDRKRRGESHLLCRQPCQPIGTRIPSHWDHPAPARPPPTGRRRQKSVPSPKRNWGPAPRTTSEIGTRRTAGNGGEQWTCFRKLGSTKESGRRRTHSKSRRRLGSLGRCGKPWRSSTSSSASRGRNSAGSGSKCVIRIPFPSSTVFTSSPPDLSAKLGTSARSPRMVPQRNLGCTPNTGVTRRP